MPGHTPPPSAHRHPAMLSFQAELAHLRRHRPPADLDPPEQVVGGRLRLRPRSDTDRPGSRSPSPEGRLLDRRSDPGLAERAERDRQEHLDREHAKRAALVRQAALYDMLAARGISSHHRPGSSAPDEHPSSSSEEEDDPLDDHLSAEERQQLARLEEESLVDFRASRRRDSPASSAGDTSAGPLVWEEYEDEFGRTCVRLVDPAIGRGSPDARLQTTGVFQFDEARIRGTSFIRLAAEDSLEREQQMKALREVSSRGERSRQAAQLILDARSRSLGGTWRLDTAAWRLDRLFQSEEDFQ
ncbi:hypothetical protein H696_04057 [Fonticula alba]|uniref:Uncharacterized protein n=1 Tax=Fonticula alba TaxID=691883 RepID=A0A058Z694_FONAL|nr:hypothetical protein H696_04057 [Fonticula alba]KCV69641.1 hypothetical protein H696_04057 [Fonticula alba]|eukprot:XP_009496206.1 hypothetical protein H696_04057 [Fonticula alba]